MSGHDLFAILCLLLTGGGLVYLIKSSRKGKDAPVVTMDPETRARAAQTIPPKLRPTGAQTSEPPVRIVPDPPSAPTPKIDPTSSSPVLAGDKKSASRREPASFTASPIKATLVSSGLPDGAKVEAPASAAEKPPSAAPASAKKAEPAPASAKKAEPAPESAKKPIAQPKASEKKDAPAASPAKKDAPASAPEPAKKAEPAKQPEAKKAEPAKQPEAKKAEPAKKADPAPVVVAAKKDAPKGKDGGKTPPPREASPKAPAVGKDAPKVAAKAEDPKKPAAKDAPSARNVPASKITPKTTIVAGSNAPPPLDPPPKKKDPLADIPKLSVEDDEDVEPTRVGKLKRREIQPPVEKHIVDEGADQAATGKASFVVHAVARTDPGRRRKQNEDSFLVSDDDGIYVVADGMGGHRGGQIASQLAVKTIGDAFAKKSFEAAAHLELPLPASELARSIQMANAAIQEEAAASPDLKGMGTTIVAARFSPDRQRLFLGHVGDSRCYRVRDGVMKQLTTDHTMADYGVAGPEGAHLSRAVGVWPTVPIDVLMVIPQLGDQYLICSDGLTKMLPHETIQTQVVHEEDPAAAVSRLVMFANAHGGKDNITVVLLRIVEPGWKPPT